MAFPLALPHPDPPSRRRRCVRPPCPATALLATFLAASAASAPTLPTSQGAGAAVSGSAGPTASSAAWFPYDSAVRAVLQERVDAGQAGSSACSKTARGG